MVQERRKALEFVWWVATIRVCVIRRKQIQTPNDVVGRNPTPNINKYLICDVRSIDDRKGGWVLVEKVNENQWKVQGLYFMGKKYWIFDRIFGIWIFFR